MNQEHTLIVKFQSPGEPEREAEHIRKVLGQQAVVETAKLFPGETSEELACLYTVNLAENIQVENAVYKLMSDAEVEYAHTPQLRKPM